MIKVKSGSDISFNFNVKVTDKTTVDEIIREASDIIKVRFAEYKVEPEESEDEEIRQGIVETIKQCTDMLDLKNQKRMLDWLEKQKENPKSADSIPSNCTSDAKYEDRWHKVDDFLPDNGREVLAKDKLGNTLLARYDGEGWDVSVYDDEDYRCHNGISKWCEIPSEKPKEQSLRDYIDDFPYSDEQKEKHKPLEKSGTAEPDYGICDDYIPAAIHVAMAKHGWYVGHVGEEEEFVLQRKKNAERNWPVDKDNTTQEQNEQKEQKSIELNNRLEEISRNGLENAHTIDFSKEYENSKQILEKGANCKEWSEEDEERIQSILFSIGYCKDEYPNKKDYSKDIDWLKSLRPQPHWKHSEEPESVAERFARIVRANLSKIDKEVQQEFEHLYYEITGNKMYGGYND